jgi:hypothetical protein
MQCSVEWPTILMFGLTTLSRSSPGEAEEKYEGSVVSLPTRYCMRGQNVKKCGIINFKYEAYIT